jgi:AcrR family transcriptional regulator
MSQRDGAMFATKPVRAAMTRAQPTRARASRSAPRGAPVVRAVIRATFEELAEVGYGALSIDDVARRAGVNKTTVYRRWPTKQDLVTAALLALPDEYFAMPNTGTVRGDLNEIACRVSRIFQAVEGRAMMRILFFEGRLTELAHVEAHFAAKREATGIPAILNRAIARGELPLGFDQQMLGDVLVGTIAFKALAEKKVLGKAFVANLVDVVLAGVLRAEPNAPASVAQALDRTRPSRRQRVS